MYVDRNGNLRTPWAPEVIGVSDPTGTEHKDFYVNKDGTVFWPSFNGAKTYDRVMEVIEITDREVLINHQSNDITQPPYLIIDGAQQDTDISASSFPSYGVPFNELSKIIPLNDGRFMTLEVNLEVESILGENTSRLIPYTTFDTNIKFQLDVFNGTTRESFLRDSIYSGDVEFHSYENTNFPFRTVAPRLFNSRNGAKSYTQQYFNWDYAVDESENTLYIVCSSCNHVGEQQVGHFSKEIFKVIAIDLSGSIAAVSNIFSIAQSHSEAWSSTYSKAANYKKGFSVTMNGDTNLLIKGIRFSVDYDVSTSTVDTSVDTVLELDEKSCLLYNGDDNTPYVWISGDGVYEFNPATMTTTGSLLIDTSSVSDAENEILLRKTKSDLVYLWTTENSRVYEMNLTTPAALSTYDGTDENFLLYFSGTWQRFCNWILRPDGAGALINQTVVRNKKLDGFAFMQDSQFGIYDSIDLRPRDFFYDREIDDETVIMKTVPFMAFGVRFNDNLRTPPINYCLGLVKNNPPFDTLNLSISNNDVLSKTPDTFDGVDEVFLFGNEQAALTNFFFVNKRFYNGGLNSSLTYKGLSPDSPDYETVMGIEATDSFVIYYRSVCRVRNRTFAVAVRSDQKDKESLSQQVFYTDGHPAGLNENSDFFLITEVQKPVKVVPLNQYAFILGEVDVGFVFDAGEANTFRFKGSTCANSLASDGDTAIWLTREGIVAARYDRCEVISDAIIDPNTFRNMSDSNFNACSGAIDTRHGLYVLNIPSESSAGKLLCFDMRSVVAALYGQIPFPLAFRKTLIGGSSFESITVSKLRSYQGHAYALVVFYESTGALYEYAAVKLFSIEAGSTSNNFGTGLLSTQGYDNQQDPQIICNRIDLGGLNAKGPTRLRITYYATNDIDVEFTSVYDGNEVSAESFTLPSGGSPTSMIEKTAHLNNIVGRYLYYDMQTDGVCEIERIELIA